MKKKLFLFLVALFVFIPFNVFASNKIYNMDIKIEIDKQAHAKITEDWHVRGEDGTEWYKVMNGLGNSELSNFKVYMDGEELKEKDWDVDETLYQKRGYYGINKTDKGLELCFGKYDYSEHTFKLEYELSNYIFNTDDAQVLYWNLVDKLSNVDFENFHVTVTSYYGFPDKLDVWGFGYKGYAYVKDGKIEMSNEENTYMDGKYGVLLVKFPKNKFDTTNAHAEYKKFADVLKAAKKGSYKYDYGDKTSFWDFLSIMFTILLFGIGGFFTFKSVRESGYGYKNNKKINYKEVPMFRDIPCNKDIYYANTLMNINSFSGYKETSILGAILLKWLRNGKILIKNEAKGMFNKETSVIDLTLKPTFDNETETIIFGMLEEASLDGMLEPKELEKWCKMNYSRFLNIFKKINTNKISELESQNHIYDRTSKEECTKKKVMDDVIYNDSVQLYGLKKYLQEFANMKDKEAIEVQLWDEYLMFAYLFGIADKVAKQFKNLYPEVVEQMDSCNLDYNTFIFINMISTSGVSAASAARSAAESYSAGGGGFSSGGGGFGSFGGGGGGSR